MLIDWYLESIVFCSYKRRMPNKSEILVTLQSTKRQAKGTGRGFHQGDTKHSFSY